MEMIQDFQIIAFGFVIAHVSYLREPHAVMIFERMVVSTAWPTRRTKDLRPGHTVPAPVCVRNTFVRVSTTIVHPTVRESQLASHRAPVVWKITVKFSTTFDFDVCLCEPFDSCTASGRVAQRRPCVSHRLQLIIVYRRSFSLIFLRPSIVLRLF